MKLIADIGNTFLKIAVFDGKKIIAREGFAHHDLAAIQKFIVSGGPYHRSILSSVIDYPPGIVEIMEKTPEFTIFDSNTAVPVMNLYETPETLGPDRLAAAIGAWSLFPGRNVLSIDAGTCITYDLVTENGAYVGGAISPGIRMRLQAMHTFTGKLPFIEPEDNAALVGRNTRESLLSGAINGVTEEINGVVALYRVQYRDLAVTITGGDHELLHNKLKINIFAAPDLVLLGLNEILDYNDQTR